MLSGKTISVKSIIAKVYRDLQLKEEEPFMDFIEWMAEALDFIHVYPQYSIKPICFKITAYKTELPCDFIGLDQIEFEGINLRATNNSFGPIQDNAVIGRYYTPYSYNQSKLENAVFVDPYSTSYFREGYSFKIENGWLKTSFKEGEINLSYISQPMDEEGYPLVPEDVSFKEALYWYVVYKYLYSKALRGEISNYFYEDAYNKWHWYCNQAGAEAMMPDLNTLENIKRSFLSLKINPYLFNNFFNSL